MKQKALTWPTTPGRWSVRVTVRMSSGGEVSMDLVDVLPNGIKAGIANLVTQLGATGEDLVGDEPSPTPKTTKEPT